MPGVGRLSTASAEGVHAFVAKGVANRGNLLRDRHLWCRLAIWLMFTAPLGRLVFVPLTPHSFRGYYLLAAAVMMAPVFCRFSRRFYERLACVLVALVYCVVSALVVSGAGASSSEVDATESPINRVAILVLLSIASLVVAELIVMQGWAGLRRALQVTCNGYLTVTLVGLALFGGYQLDVLSVDALSPFFIILDFNMGSLRFSPGSSANEYGVFASAMTCLLFYLANNRRARQLVCPRWLQRNGSVYLACGVSLITVALSTTRTAYVTVSAGLLVIALMSGGRARLNALIGGAVTAGIVVLIVISSPAVGQFFDAQWTAAVEGEGSVDTRFTDWKLAYEAFVAQPLTGGGFGSFDMIHNTYLQLVFNLGIAGSTLFAASFAGAFWVSGSVRYPAAGRDQQELAKAIRAICVIGALHTLMFAAVNHNLNQYLTWLTFIAAILTKSFNQRPAGLMAPVARGG